jgi:2'-5' RNA ligase
MPNDPTLSAPSQRLFLALWPDAAVQSQLAAHAQRWRWPARCAPYQPQDWHVTLHFIGRVDARQVADLTTRAAVPFQPFELVLNKPVLWPQGLAVLCPDELPKQLWSLFDRLGQVLRGLDLTVETRPYRPHLTLARQAEGAVAPSSFAPVRWLVQSYALVVSTRDKDERYKVIRTYT